MIEKRIWLCAAIWLLYGLWPALSASSSMAQTVAPVGNIHAAKPTQIAVATGRNPTQWRAPSKPPAAKVKTPPPRRLALAAIPQSGACASGAYPAPILALASALKCDPDLIFEYVYNNIEYEPLYGSNKGPLGTLLDRRGNDSDQVLLLVTLWNAAGYSQTGFENFYFTGVTGTQLANWLGVPNDAAQILNLLAAGGVPYSNAVTNTDGSLQSINLDHFEGAISISGVWYFFDPSWKAHTLVAGVSNLGSALGYTRSQFLSDSGGTIDSVSISNASRTNLRSDLVSYASNLSSYIAQNNRTWSLANLIGGKLIPPLQGSPIRVQYVGVTPASTFPVDCPNQSNTVECRTYITVQMDPSQPSKAIKLYTDQVYGHRITIFSSAGSAGKFIPTLLIDGVAPSCVGAGTCVNVGPAQLPAQQWSIATTVVQPNQPTGSGCATGVSACKSLTITPGGSFLISTGVGQVSRGMAEYHRQLIAQARAAGNLDTSEPVLGENLATIGYSWLAECSSEQQVMAQLAQATTLYNYALGIVGQTVIQSSGYKGPYVDLPVNQFGINPLVSSGPTTVVGGLSYPTPFVSALVGLAETESSLESAVLQQTQAPTPGMIAASTVRVIDANMNSSYSGALNKTFFADGTTSAGKTAYTNTIKPAIQSHYSATDLNTITTAVTGGQQVVIPQNGQLGVGVWAGSGTTEIYPVSGLPTYALSVGQKISGGMSGGFSGTDVDDPAENTEVTLAPPAATDTVDPLFNSQVTPSDPFEAEPVDGVTGAYVYKHDDLVSGGGKFPYALSFSRTYSSASGTYLTTPSADQGMGAGWAHTFSIGTQVESDPYSGIGTATTPASTTVTSIAALYVMQDLLSQTPNSQIMTVSSMVAQWFTDQLTGNVAMVSQPDTIEEFIAAPHADGATTIAYNPPPSSSDRLTQTGAGQFAFLLKDGTALNFGGSAPAGALRSWVFPSGVAVNLTYTGSLLSKVTNNLGRSLALTYSGSDVSKVTDDTGRSVNYTYDTNHNLTQFSDPLGFGTTYAYDASGKYDTMGHLTQVFYPANPGNPFVTNWYDPMGRVAKQANANGYASQFYFASSRTELIDPAGDRHVTYQTDRGKILTDAWVLSSSFGDVFNDTPQQNGVINVTTNQYDGIDRLTLTTLPEGGSTTLVYAANPNPWANNVASVTRNAKPGSPLVPLTTNYLYGAAYNKPVQITDPLGYVTQLTYAGATGNLLSVVADAGRGAHFNATTRLTYDSLGHVLTSTDPLGVVTQYAYDSHGNPTSIVGDANGLRQTTLIAYSVLGDAVQVTDPNQNVSLSAYDADRRRTSSTTPGLPETGTGRTSTNIYDADGNLLQTQISANGTLLSTTSTTYSLSGQPVTQTDANGNVTKLAYDAVDRLQRTTDPINRVTTYAYDAMSRKTSLSNPAITTGPLEQWSYTPDGLVGSLTDANGKATTFTPDGLDRLGTTLYPDSSTEVLGYDADSNVLTRQTRRGDTITLTYDSLNRLATKATPSEASVSYSYDLNGRMIGASDNSAAINPATTGASYVSSYSYDAINRPLAVSWTPAPLQTTPATATSASFSFAYDTSNRLIRQQASDAGWWSYPATAGATGYTANALSQYSAVGAVSPSYDGDGDLTYDGTFTYAYDAERRLTSIVQGGATLATYAYDALGRRKSKTAGGVTTLYALDADGREALEYTASAGATQAWYAYGVGSAAVLGRMNLVAGSRQTLIPDRQGSVFGFLDSGGGLTRFGYQAFGENPTSATNGFRYTAQRLDAETAGGAAQPSGLYDFGSRIYSPALARFNQPDSIGYSAGTNLYAYVGNDPLNHTDSTGMAPDEEVSLSQPNFSSSSTSLSSGPVFGGGYGGGFAGGATPATSGANAFDYTSSALATSSNFSLGEGAGGAPAENGLADLATFRSELGLAPASPGATTLTRLDVGGQSFYGISGHGQPIIFSINAVSATHAEADAFQQAINAGANANIATLYVDNVNGVCGYCSRSGISSMLRASGINTLTIVTPIGTINIGP